MAVQLYTCRLRILFLWIKLKKNICTLQSMGCKLLHNWINPKCTTWNNFISKMSISTLVLWYILTFLILKVSSCNQWCPSWLCANFLANRKIHVVLCAISVVYIMRYLNVLVAWDCIEHEKYIVMIPFIQNTEGNQWIIEMIPLCLLLFFCDVFSSSLYIMSVVAVEIWWCW